MTTLKEIFCIGDVVSFVNVKISVGSTPTKSLKEQSIRKVQSLIKIKLDEVEQIPGWRLLPPSISNAVRHTIIRIAFAAYKIGLIG